MYRNRNLEEYSYKIVREYKNKKIQGKTVKAFLSTLEQKNGLADWLQRNAWK